MMPQPLAIQSWCFRHFKTIPEFCTQLKAAGVSATEICGVHGNFSDPATFADQLAQYKKAGVQLVAIGVETMTGNIDKDKPRFEFCKQAGIREMSITFGPEAMFDGLRNVKKLCDQYDMTVGIHNHGGYDWLAIPSSSSTCSKTHRSASDCTWTPPGPSTPSRTRSRWLSNSASACMACM
jgi:hypothetical protein